jgi:hypothetical protein
VTRPTCSHLLYLLAGFAAAFVLSLLTRARGARPVEDDPAFQVLMAQYRQLEADNRELRLQVAALRGTGEVRP